MLQLNFDDGNILKVDNGKESHFLDGDELIINLKRGSNPIEATFPLSVLEEYVFLDNLVGVMVVDMKRLTSFCKVEELQSLLSTFSLN